MGMSQKGCLEELAGRAELHRTYIADIERGARNVSLKNIEKIVDGLAINIADLFSRFSKTSSSKF